MKAAVLPAYDTPIETRDDIEIAPPGPGEVRIKVVASGVCHSDLSVQNGTIPLPTPIVLGHEGAGIVEEVGEGVTKVAVGDHVVLSFVPACGECYTCTRVQPLRYHAVGLTSFSQDHLDFHGDMDAYFAAKRLLAK